MKERDRDNNREIEWMRGNEIRLLIYFRNPSDCNLSRLKLLTCLG